MADTQLTARFKLIDEMSDRLERISEAGHRMTDSWSEAQSATNTAVDAMTSEAERASRAISNASDSMDGWTNAANAFDKSAMEAMYSLEELVNMGLKSQSVLDDYNALMEASAENSSALSEALDAAETSQENLTAAQKEADKLAEKLNQSKFDTVELQNKLSEAQAEAAEAQDELTAAQQSAAEALDKYNQLIESGTASFRELEQADEAVVNAYRKVEDATNSATEAESKLTEETENTQKEFDKLNSDPLKEISNALVTLGISKGIKEITDEVIDLTNAFSEAESTIVKATGATGAALDDLSVSMLNVYSASKTGNMKDTSAAIGEINTRMHLTGTELEQTTEKFLDFAEVTGGQVTTSVKYASQIMNKWNVEGENVSDVLDKLTYATQISGININNLSSQLVNGAAVYQNMGLSLDNTINMLAEFELAGINSSSAMMGLRQAVNKAAKEGEDANEYLLKTVRTISELDDATQATALATEVFGTRAGQELALAIRSGTLSIETFTSDLTEAEGALNRTAEEAQTVEQKWEQASNNIKTAFTKNISPAVDSASSSIAGFVNGIGDFLNQHGELVRYLAALGVGLGVVVAGFAGFYIVKTLVIPAIINLTRAVVTATAASGPWALLAIGVTAVTAAVATFALTSSECKYNLDELNESIDATHEAYASVADGLDASADQITRETSEAEALSNKLKELASSSDGTERSQRDMKNVLAELNEMFPELGINVEGVTENIDDLINKVDAYNEATAKQKEYEFAVKTYNELTTKIDRDELVKAVNDADIALRKATDNFAIKDFWDIYTNPLGSTSFAWDYITNSGVVAEQKAAEERAAKAQKDLDDYDRKLKEATDTMERYGEVVAGTSDEQIKFGEGAAIAISETKDKTTELIESYRDAYNEAYKSISGQMGLFEQMAVKCDITTDQMIAALKSQSAYLETYTENLQAAAQYGLDEGLIASLSDGSKESAGYLNAIVDKIDALGKNSEEAKKFIDDMNSSFTDVQTGKEEFATAVADMKTDFSSELEAIQKEMEEMIAGFNMSEEAAEAAKATIDAYIEALKNGSAEAVDVATLIQSAMAGALSGVPDPEKTPEGTKYGFNSFNYDYVSKPGTTSDFYNSRYVSTYASGTTNASDVAIVGENGPELITGIGGASVFPSSETDRIIAAVNRREPLFVDAPSYSAFKREGSGGNASPEAYKKITLEIAGSGTIGIQKGTNKEEVIELLTNNIRPVLLELLEEETFEEGEGCYDF